MHEQHRIVIAANFTADPIADSLHFWCRQPGWPDEVRFAPYNQVFQTLLAPNSAFSANAAGTNVLLLRADRIAVPEELAAAVRTFGGPVVVALCPSPAPSNELETLLAGIRTVTLISTSDFQQLYPVPDPFDTHAEHLGDVPYTPLFYAALGTMLVRTIHALHTRPFKLIALDCDNTLWDGTCGEDGPEGVRTSEPRRLLHEFMRTQREAGMLLALASRNNERDVLDTFQAHPTMPLGLADFIAMRISWQSKSVGLAAMAEDLSLGLDSFILLDDSAKEIAEVRAACPEVLGLELPHAEARIPHFLAHVWAFDHLRITDEDRARNTLYQEQATRGKLERQAGTLEEFLASLCVEIHLQPVTEAQLPRVAQLTQRTSQMNTTLVRRTEQQVTETECWAVDVSDRFGSYGLVGAMFLARHGETLVIENLLLSCRALGRGVEQRMVARVRELALERGLPGGVQIPFVEGPRNQPARDFVAALTNGASVKIPSASAPPADAAPVPQRFDYARIARDLSRPAQILEAMRAAQHTREASFVASELPGTELEKQLAAIWADVLHVARPGIHQDFFDLGGHSLLAVQLFSRVRQQLGADLQMDLLYSGKLTIAGMAAAVELAQADPEEMDRLLAEIDNLSEEELQALLEEG